VLQKKKTSYRPGLKNCWGPRGNAQKIGGKKKAKAKEMNSKYVQKGKMKIQCPAILGARRGERLIKQCWEKGVKFQARGGGLGGGFQGVGAEGALKLKIEKKIEYLAATSGRGSLSRKRKH